MKVRLSHVWDVLSSSFWFVPAAMTTVAGGAAIVLVEVDRTFIGPGIRIGWLYSGGAEGARSLLSTVAGSIITVAGVVFSITISALVQASSQFGPRLLRNFMRDTSNQVVLGTFVATFLYCLLVLRTIHEKINDGVSFVPQLSVTVAVALAVASIAVLIYFIHHVSLSLQAPNVIAAARADLARVVKSIMQEQDGTDRPRSDPPTVADGGPPADGCPIPSDKDGYLQAIDYDALVAAATAADLVLHLARRPGEYVIQGGPLLHASPPDRCPPGLAKTVNDAFICGTQRTAEPDVEYAVRQIVEVAVRALSPGINDPFTAMNGVDALGSAICLLGRTGLPTGRRFDAHDGTLRLVSPVTTFAGITNLAFDQIRQYGRDSVAVTVRLLEVIGDCLAQAHDAALRQALQRQAAMVYAQSQDPDAIHDEHDRDDVKSRWDSVCRTLTSPA